MTEPARAQAVVQRLLLTVMGEVRGIKYRAALEESSSRGRVRVSTLATGAWRDTEELAQADMPALLAIIDQPGGDA